MPFRIPHVGALAIIVATLAMMPEPVQANPVERACLQSNRPGVSRSLCACIGRVADATLTRGQMRQGARFFRDPQRAQDVRMSNRRSDEELWRAWREFGERAEQSCGG
jgi:hypothetical protein